MRVYLDTGIFLDYLSTRGHAHVGLRTVDRRGRNPRQIAADAERLFEKVSRVHDSATSCLTFYEVEEALYRMLAHSAKGVSRADAFLVPAARSITMQVQMVVELFNISVLDVTASTIRLQLRQIELQTHAVRAADALHIASAIAFGADLVMSTDEGLLQLDGILANTRGDKIRCQDTDVAIEML